MERSGWTIPYIILDRLHCMHFINQVASHSKPPPWSDLPCDGSFVRELGLDMQEILAPGRNAR